jgi:hypothetical protein
MVSGGTGTVSCARCGAEAHGNFCGACGASLAGGRKSALDLPLLGETIDLVRTFWQVTRAPIAEPVRIAALADDKSPFRFLITGIGIFIGFFLGIEALARAWGNAGFTKEQDQFLNIAKFVIFLDLVIAAAVVYVASALIAGRKVSLGSHARLWALLSGYYLAAEAILLITVVAVYGLVCYQLPAIAPVMLKIYSIALLPVVAGIFLLMLVNLVVAHARQWARPLWMSVAIFALALVIMHSIAPLLLSAVGGLARKLGM